MCGTGQNHLVYRCNTWTDGSYDSLMRSEILQPRDLEDRKLGGPPRLQKLYSSTQQGRAAFFEYLREATQNFERRLLVIKVCTIIDVHLFIAEWRVQTDDRFSVGVLLRGPIAWDDDVSLYFSCAEYLISGAPYRQR